MSILDRLRARLLQVLHDPEYARLGPSLKFNLGLRAGEGKLELAFENGRFGFADTASKPSVAMAASEAVWAKVLESPPPPTFHSFTALDLVNPDFTINADPLALAQARPVLERLIERLVDARRSRQQARKGGCRKLKGAGTRSKFAA